jgi:hypothetical protein
MTRLSGTVTRSGNPQANATVYVVDRDTNSVVATTTSDANGDWNVSGLATNAEERYHALVEYDDGAQQYNALSLPYLSTDAYLAAPASEVAMQHPQASLGPAIPDSGVSRWKFEQNLLDAWDGNDGTDNTSAGYTADSKVGSYAKSFDGVDDYVSFGDPSNLNFGTGSFSLSAWAKCASVHDGAVFIKRPASGEFNGWSLAPRQSADAYRFYIKDGNGDQAAAESTTNIQTGTWTHIAGVRDSSADEIRIYIDGSREDAVSSTSVGDVSTSSPLEIGLRSEDSIWPFDGDIDDPRVYSKALSDSEVSNLYSTGDIRG